MKRLLPLLLILALAGGCTKQAAEPTPSTSPQPSLTAIRLAMAERIAPQPQENWFVQTNPAPILEELDTTWRRYFGTEFVFPRITLRVDGKQPAPGLNCELSSGENEPPREGYFCFDNGPVIVLPLASFNEFVEQFSRDSGGPYVGPSQLASMAMALLYGQFLTEQLYHTVVDYPFVPFSGANRAVVACLTGIGLRLLYSHLVDPERMLPTLSQMTHDQYWQSYPGAGVDWPKVMRDGFNHGKFTRCWP